MQKKTLLIAALTVSATLAGVVVAGSAFGADWSEYEGRLSAGNAYLVPVPEGSDTLSFALVPNGEAPTAQIVVFDADDNRLGHYAIADESQADIVDPITGDYIVYVYELKQASLSIRLQSRDAGDEPLKVAKIDTKRTDRPIVRNHDGGALDKQLTMTVDREPVFATVLYQGSVENLQATIETQKGIVLSVTGESGVSYAPGLNVGAASQRESFLDNLVKGPFHVTATADDFDGTLYLTTLTVSRPLVRPVAEAPEPPREVPDKGEIAPPQEFVIPQGAPITVGIPIAVDVTDSELALALPSAFFACDFDEVENEEEAYEAAHDCHERHKENHESYSSNYNYDNDCILITVFGPDDRIVAEIALSEDEPLAMLEDLTPGEYVIFAMDHYAYEYGRYNYNSEGGTDAAAEQEPVALLVRPDAPEETLNWRAIALVNGEAALGQGEQPLGYSDSIEIAFPAPPLALKAWTTEETIALDHSAYLESPEGMVFHSQNYMDAPFMWNEWFTYQEMNRDNLAPGLYTFEVHAGAYLGTTGLSWITYDRDFAFGEAPNIEETESEEEDEDDDAREPAGTYGLPAAVNNVLSLFR